MRGLAVMLLTLLGSATAGVLETRHNMSVTGIGSVTSTTEDEVCVFCHAAHVENTVGPLWNHETSGAVTYDPYQSSTMATTPGQPNGVSRLCLSCHDGTIAVGAVVGEASPITMRGVGVGGRLRVDSEANLGSDLSGSHPVSMSYAEASRRRRASATTWLHANPISPDGRPLLDNGGLVQCTSCHDPHEDPAARGLDVPPFWRGATFSEVCEACHEGPLVEAGHSDPTLLPDGCGSCHVGHGAPRQPMLPRREEAACYECHGSAADVRDAVEAGRITPSSRPVRVDDLFALPYVHPVEQSRDLHRADEDLRVGGTRTQRHVECVDCHPTHGAGGRARPGLAPRGIVTESERSGRPEHELCFDCHGSVSHLPFGHRDKAAEFNPANASYHPILAPSAGRAPSLKSPWVSGDRMTCSDCHGPGSEDVRRGPHGSRNAWILRGAYIAQDGAPESEDAYEACYDCHSRGAVLSRASFPGHPRHVVDGLASCYACHDSHGSPQYPGLVRFGKDERYGQVLPSRSGRLEYDPQQRQCWLTCHDVNHDPLGYP